MELMKKKKKKKTFSYIQMWIKQVTCFWKLDITQQNHLDTFENWIWKSYWQHSQIPYEVQVKQELQNLVFGSINH